MTHAQYRLLKRIVSGERLPVSRFRPMHATIASLHRKKHVGHDQTHWHATPLGRDFIAARGHHPARRIEAEE
jgi:hypothetical protein